MASDKVLTEKNQQKLKIKLDKATKMWFNDLSELGKEFR